MAVAARLGEGGAIAGARQCLAVILDQHQLAFEQIDELVRMPVALARPCAWRQVHEIDPEIAEPAPTPPPEGKGRCVAPGDICNQNMNRTSART